MESRTNDFSILVLRLATGVIMLTSHGWGKLTAYSALSLKFADPLGVGPAMSLGLVIFAEVVCAGLVALGLFTRLATIPLMITMAVAAFKIHALDPWNKKELPVLFLAGFFVIFLSGGGRYSLQNFFKISSNSRFPFISWLMR